MLEIKIDNADMLRMLRDTAAKMENAAPLMHGIAGVMLDAVETNFAAEGRPKWKPSQRVKMEGGRTLQKSGIMAGSVTPWSDKASAVVGTNMEYAPTHQFGWPERNIPPRPFLPTTLTAREWADIADLARKYLKGG